MYAQALNETLSELGAGPGGVQRPRGDLVTRRMWNRTFSGQILWMKRTFIVFHETTKSRNILTAETR